MSKIIILSTKADSHLKFVTNHLSGEEILLINPTDMFDGDAIDYVYKDRNVQVYYKDKLLNDVKSVWLRRPTQLSARRMPVKTSHIAHVKNAVGAHLEMFSFAFPEALWVSDSSAIKFADRKIVQLRLAAEIGFHVPETLFASTPRRAKEFVDKHGICIAKTMAHILPLKTFAFTKVLRSGDDIDYTNLNLDPYIFQQYIEPSYELRVTVVGDQIFAAKVEGEETDGLTSQYRDWRYAHANDTFKATALQLSPELTKKCVRFVRELNLEFGALDLIVDKKGHTWFLEINPNGQWAFVEMETGQPIGKAIAEKLKRGKQSQGSRKITTRPSGS